MTIYVDMYQMLTVICIYIIYTSCHGNIMHNHYADDTQLYISFKPCDSISRQTVISQVDPCLARQKHCIDDDIIIKWKHVTGFLWGKSTGDLWILLKKASDAELWCFLWSTPEQMLSKQSRRRWFKTPSCSLWHHCNEDASSNQLRLPDPIEPHLLRLYPQQNKWITQVVQLLSGWIYLRKC